jgi:hypothetical protein
MELIRKTWLSLVCGYKLMSMVVPLSIPDWLVLNLNSAGHGSNVLPCWCHDEGFVNILGGLLWATHLSVVCSRHRGIMLTILPCHQSKHSVRVADWVTSKWRVYPSLIRIVSRSSINMFLRVRHMLQFTPDFS